MHNYLLKFRLVFFAAVFSCAAPAFACDNCGVYTPLNARELVPETVRMGIRQDLFGYSKTRRGGEIDSNVPSQNLKTDVTEISAAWDVNSYFGLTAQVPFVNNHAKWLDFDDTASYTSEAGLGDVALYVPVSLFQYTKGKQEFLLQFIPGIKLATGDTARLKDELLPQPLNRSIRGSDMTLGTGSYDVPLGAAMLFRQDRFLFDGYVEYILRTEGDHGYRFADDLRWRSTLGIYAVDTSDALVIPKFAVSGIWKDHDELNGSKVSDSGLTELFVGPALSVIAFDRVELDLVFDFPVYFENDGLQNLQDHLVRILLNVRL